DVIVSKFVSTQQPTLLREKFRLTLVIRGGVATVTTFTHNFKRAIHTHFPFPSKALSSACSCIVSAPTIVVSSTTSATVPVPATVSTTVGDGAATTTVDATTDLTTLETITLPPKATSTTFTSVSTSTVKAQAPEQCGNGRGGPPVRPNAQYTFGPY